MRVAALVRDVRAISGVETNPTPKKYPRPSVTPHIMDTRELSIVVEA